MTRMPCIALLSTVSCPMILVFSGGDDDDDGEDDDDEVHRREEAVPDGEERYRPLWMARP